METFDERPQVELNPSSNQGFTGLHRDSRIVKNAVHAVLPEHCDDDGSATSHIVLQAVAN